MPRPLQSKDYFMRSQAWENENPAPSQVEILVSILTPLGFEVIEAEEIRL